MKSVLLKAITAYQQHLSPHKGFRCAHHAQKGRGSCSSYGQRVIARFGAMTGLRLLRRRLAECGGLARQHGELARLPSHPQRTTRDWRREGGFLDGCDGCDLSGCDLPTPGSISSCVPQAWRKQCDTVLTIVFVLVVIVMVAVALWTWLK